MSFFDSLFWKAPPTGYIKDAELWLQDLPKHEFFAGGDTSPIDWSSFAPLFRSQESTLMCTAFAGCNVASMLNKRETGESIQFSPLELFIRSKGFLAGNTIQNTIQAMQKKIVRESECPWVGPINEWNPLILSLLGAYAKSESSKASDERYAVKGLTYVMPDRESMREALKTSPLFVVLNVGRGYFDNPAPAVNGGSSHATVATWVALDGKIKIFDSLTQSSTFDGFHWLSSDFPVLYAFGVLDLPNNWQEQQKNSTNQAYATVLGRYGLPINYIAQNQAAAVLMRAKTQNPTHAAYIVALWDVYVYAIAYGGYSLQDILNQITSIRRGQGAIFDFNQQHKH